MDLLLCVYWRSVLGFSSENSENFLDYVTLRPYFSAERDPLWIYFRSNAYV